MKSCYFAISLWLLTSCATVPPNVPVFENLQQHLSTDPVTGHLLLAPSPACMEMIGEPECGHGVYIMSGEEIYIGEKAPHLLGGKKWSELKAQSIYLPAIESYSPIAKYIINSCEQNNCNDQVDRYRVKLDSLNGIGAILQP